MKPSPVRRSFLLLMAVLSALLTAGCGSRKGPDETGGAAPGYSVISQEEAKTLLDEGRYDVLLDVRRKDEYEAGHIPGALLLPNEEIGTEPPGLLPDKDAVILIYCRSGNRSKQAAAKLAAMGYTHLLEFGGILTWPFETVR